VRSANRLYDATETGTRKARVPYREDGVHSGRTAPFDARVRDPRDTAAHDVFGRSTHLAFLALYVWRTYGIRCPECSYSSHSK